MKKELKRALKKSNKSILICMSIFLFIGIISGFITVTHLTRNDTFELIGDKSITLEVNETYIEPGVKIISFGKDVKDDIKIESNLDTSKEGQYTIIYTINSSRYKNIQRVRYVNVVNGSDTNE